MEAYNLIDVYENEIASKLDVILEICETHRLPMVCSFQTGTEVFYNTKLLFTERTDPRLYLTSRVLEHGDPRFVTIYDRSQVEFDELDRKHKELLATILKQLEEHDLQYMNYKEPAGLCKYDFAQLRKLIETQLQSQHLPPGG